MARKVNVEDLAGVAELATRLGVSVNTLNAWRRRYPDFPEPVARLTGSHVWAWPDVERWARATGRLPS